MSTFYEYIFAIYFFLFSIFSSTQEISKNIHVNTLELAQKIESSIFPLCKEPITFGIGEIDKEFNLSKEDAMNYSIEAAKLWNDSIGVELLKYSDNPKVRIDFKFDERQANLIRDKIFKEKINDQKYVLKVTSNTISASQDKFVKAKEEYEEKRKLLDIEIYLFNSKISEVNKSGGALPDQAIKLDQEKSNLDRKVEILNSERAKLNEQINIINSQINEFNKEVKNVNVQISNENRKKGTEFEEGIYTNNQIIVYAFYNELDLKRLLAHELGHALGLDHVEDRKSIMYYLNYNDELVLSENDIAELKNVCGFVSRHPTSGVDVGSQELVK